MILEIAKNEFKSLFRIPLGWVLLSLCLLLFGTFYYSLINIYLNKQHFAIPVDGISYEIANILFGSSIYPLIVIVPVLAMRAISNEKYHNTLSLLFAAPISEWQILAGKFIGIIAFQTLLLAMMLLMSLTLTLGGTLDYGMLLSGLLGVFLIMLCFTAIAFWIASLSSQPTVAVTAAMSALLFTFFLESIALTSIGWLDSTITWLSLISHLDSFLRGIIHSRDVFYYLIISACAMTLTLIQFKKLRTAG